jgi:chromosome segregation ATPase
MQPDVMIASVALLALLQNLFEMLRNCKRLLKKLDELRNPMLSTVSQLEQPLSFQSLKARKKRRSLSEDLTPRRFFWHHTAITL